MRRHISLLCLSALAAASLYAQSGAPSEPARRTEQPRVTEQEPPEEDRGTAKPVEYTFNPLQAEKEVSIGKFYAKKHSYRAAARRFEEATKWNPGLADAWLLLGDTQTKLNDTKAARSAYQQYIQLAPDTKESETLKKKLGINATQK